MNCPSCKHGVLKVTHSYATSGGQTQRRECENCLTVATSTVMLVNVDPVRGQGAKALAKRLQAPR